MTVCEQEVLTELWEEAGMRGGQRGPWSVSAYPALEACRKLGRALATLKQWNRTSRAAFVFLQPLEVRMNQSRLEFKGGETLERLQLISGSPS